MSERKRRTREHVIADLAINFVQRVILGSGHVAEERTKSDYGYDLAVTTFDDDGYVEEGAVQLQIKATENLARYDLESGTIGFPIDIRDWRLWRKEAEPVFLILYEASRRRAYWLYLQPYFNTQALPDQDASSLTIHIPKKNVLRRDTISLMRSKKMSVLRQIGQVIRHD
jgi:hypothetical protein